ARPDGPPVAVGTHDGARAQPAVQLSVAAGTTLSMRIVCVRVADWWPTASVIRVSIVWTPSPATCTAGPEATPATLPSIVATPEPAPSSPPRAAAVSVMGAAAGAGAGAASRGGVVRGGAPACCRRGRGVGRSGEVDAD